MHLNVCDAILETSQRQSEAQRPWAGSSVKRVGSGAPITEEQAEANGFKDTGKGAHSDSINRALFGEDLRDELWLSKKLIQRIINSSWLRLTLGAELAINIKLPMYAAPL